MVPFCVSGRTQWLGRGLDHAENAISFLLIRCCRSGREYKVSIRELRVSDLELMASGGLAVHWHVSYSLCACALLLGLVLAVQARPQPSRVPGVAPATELAWPGG